eukprot:GHRR01022312.1.p1 GENE.GHRR01022312.1~~GHRR01022312.1.p1  ORF type:complete len:402 (+),score=137.36 GHRR01022312.1:1604-2809(+)
MHAGGNAPQDYASLLRQHSRLPPDSLVQLLQQSLTRLQSSAVPGANVSPIMHSSCRSTVRQGRMRAACNAVAGHSRWPAYSALTTAVQVHLPMELWCQQRSHNCFGTARRLHVMLGAAGCHCHSAVRYALQGLNTLLAEGPLAALPALAAPQQPPRPLWLRNPTQHAALPLRQLLQQAGMCRANSCSNSASRLPLQLAAPKYCHHATFRGHGFPVFALLFDKEGKRVVTGADDALIKVWSLETGLLLVTSRGHTGEISDLSLSADGRLVASGATDTDVRVWSMQPETLGQTVAVLCGHTGPITLIAFHPKLPTALLSASADGTVRVWDAVDQHFAPLLLVPSEQFGSKLSAMFGSYTADAAAAAASGGPGQAAATGAQQDTVVAPAGATAGEVRLLGTRCS